MVQIGVPLQSRELYGKPQFWPLWEAAVDARACRSPCTSRSVPGIALPPTPSGNTRTYEQYVSFMALNYLYHLMNMIAEGVFERFAGLKFVWADGAADMMTPFIWRMDMLRPPAPRADAVGAEDARATTCPATCYFVQGSLDGPGDTDFAGEVVRLHRQGRHGDVRLELSALAARRAEAMLAQP